MVETMITYCKKWLKDSASYEREQKSNSERYILRSILEKKRRKNIVTIILAIFTLVD